MMHCGGQARPIARPAGGKTRRRGRRVGRRGVGEEGRRPCPQLRTGYVKQPGRPAGRCVRLTCPPALLLPCLHDGQKELAGMPRPSKSQFFVPCHFRLFPIESSIKASHYVPPFFFFQLHPFRAGFQGLLPRSPFVENSYSSSFRVLLKIIWRSIELIFGRRMIYVDGSFFRNERLRDGKGRSRWMAKPSTGQPRAPRFE